MSNILNKPELICLNVVQMVSSSVIQLIQFVLVPVV